MTYTRYATALFPRALLGASCLLPMLAGAQIAPIKYELTGDVGGAVYGTQSVIRSKGNETRLLPYGFFDYGRLAVRVDTLSLKTVKFGYGYLELAGRVSQDGWRADTAALSGLKDRKTPIPLGIGTFQETPYGALFLNAFVDANKSHGTLLEATYAAESAASGFSVYNAGASTAPVLGLGVDVPLGEPWTLTMQLRRKWLDSSVRNSPLLSRRTQDTGFIAVSYRFR